MCLLEVGEAEGGGVVVEGAARVLRKKRLKAEFLKVKPRCCRGRIFPPTPCSITLNLVRLSLSPAGIYKQMVKNHDRLTKFNHLKQEDEK